MLAEAPPDAVDQPVWPKLLAATIHAHAAPASAAKRIDRDIRLSEAQRAALSDLIDSSKQAADVIAKSCPADTSLTPVGPMQARRKQLETIGRAIQTVRQALGDFYQTPLDDRQTRRRAATI